MVYFLLGLGLVGIWIAVDIIKAARKKPLPDLPNQVLDPTGLSLIYHYLTEPEKVPAEVTIDEQYIYENLRPSLEFIDSRYDCADFRIQLLFRLYKDCYEKLTPELRGIIKQTFLDFKYWMDEPGEDSMCYWSENHQILFAVSEYLAGQEWPRELFTNSGITGKEHRDRALKRINLWMEQKFKYGFYEWYSNNYYAENIAAMSNFIQYAADRDSVDRMKVIFDLLWFDVATHSVNNTFVPASSRMYGDNKASDLYGNRIKAAMNEVWLSVDTAKLVRSLSSVEKNILEGEPDVETLVKLVGVDAQMMQNFIAMYRAGLYDLPSVIYDIALDQEPVVVKTSSGLDVQELVQEGLIGMRDDQIMAQWGCEAFTNPQVIENSLQYLSRNNMFRNKFVNPFRFINIKLLRMLKVPALISSRLGLMTNGISLDRGNVYSYRTRHYVLTTAVAHNVNGCGAQEHIWSANIAPDLAIFTTHPARDDESREKHGASPGYWVGNGRQPMSVQEENVNITIYRLPEKKRLLEFHLADITHAYMPKEKFDVLEFYENYLFALRDQVMVAMATNGAWKYRQFDSYAASLFKNHDHPENGSGVHLNREFDLVREGGKYHIYVTELSDTDCESFAEFKQRILNNQLRFAPGSVSYQTRGKNIYVSYDRTFKINGKSQIMEYPRHYSRYAEVDRKPGTIHIKCNGRSWCLDFNSGARKRGNF